MNNILSLLRGIQVKSTSIEIISEPQQFYETLCKLSEESTKRISLSTLYLGTGDLEKELINKISTNEGYKNGSLKVNFLCDYLRGSRGSTINSITMLKDLYNKGNLYLYHTPELRGLTKKILPERVNEIIGLQHMKFYVFDDDVIISGANLSNDYFTTRQDRYIYIKNCPQLAEYFNDLLLAIGTCSFKIDGYGDVKLDDNCLVHPFEGNINDFRNMVISRVLSLKSKHEIIEKFNDKEDMTIIFPLLNMGCYNICEENDFLNSLFSSLSLNDNLTIASGYFNLTENYFNTISKNKNSNINIITASPRANGFYGGKGLSSNIPSLYVQVSKDLYNKNHDNIKLYEYYKDKWTFHGKGIWYESLENPSHILTVVGSSNYGERSSRRDLEAQLVIVTNDEVLKNRLIVEKNNLINNCHLVNMNTFLDPEHIVPLWVKYSTKLLRHFF
uniref:CDP-diacylglycerol--glycerol-3-phosphate 3-phosphatidyltransferase n=1 Tax=Parastrongyloides trichosuri TaxID=131310 RepID=A0A0N4Z4L3_PARTI